jgi:predicted nucleotidyltransferase component of viral defense system
MIQEVCTTKEWISEIALQKKADKSLVQKLIRALILLEGLSESNIEFVFKGGTALMLLLDSTKRLSIDIDIIIPQTIVNFEQKLSEIATKKGFLRVEEQHRIAASGIEKAHYKFYYNNSLKNNSLDFILLDVLFEDIHYNHLVSCDIKSSFVKHDGIIARTKTPDFNNIMGDKLTAFSPNSTGIPYFKNEKPMGQEIIKQLYDIGNIFERINDVQVVDRVFKKIAIVELQYRNIPIDFDNVFNDIIENCLSITLRQKIGNTNFDVLLLGLKQISNYIFSETYHIEKATIHAARIAYLISLIQNGASIIEHYTNKTDMTSWKIELPNNTKLNKLKKTNPEAFYYWFKYSQKK